MYKEYTKKCSIHEKPLQIHPTYNKCVKIGNWFEERELEDELIRNYLYKRDNQLLTSQKVEKMNKLLLKPEDLTFSPSKHVKYGDKVMVVNTPITPMNTRIKPLCLYVPRNTMHLKCIDASYFDAPVKQLCVSSAIYYPTIISSFVIRGPTAGHDGSLLRYGDPFYLFTSTEKLVLASAKQTPFLPANNISGNNWALLTSGCSRNSLFRVLPLRDFLDLEGEPVSANSRVLINHVLTNENLCVEDQVLDGFFGEDNEVSCKSIFDQHRFPSVRNHWCFYMDASNKDNFPLKLPPQD